MVYNFLIISFQTKAAYVLVYQRKGTQMSNGKLAQTVASSTPEYTDTNGFGDENKVSEEMDTN